MAVSDFDTKVAVVVRDDLAVWQKLNVTAFLVSGVVAAASERVVGEAYCDADGAHYLPLLVQPVLVFATTTAKLHTVRRRAGDRDVALALYTNEMFATGHDIDNRAAVKAVPTEQLDAPGARLHVASRVLEDPGEERDMPAAATGTPEQTFSELLRALDALDIANRCSPPIRRASTSSPAARAAAATACASTSTC